MTGDGPSSGVPTGAVARVAIIGYPNVGKSTLYNRITGTREAVVAPESGVTRDRKEGEAEWNGRAFAVVDTGGIDFWSEAPLSDKVRHQAQIAVSEASVIIFLLDGKVGVAPQDFEIAALLRRSGVPVVLAVNKQDAHVARDNLNEYWELGLGEPIGVSAEHGLGVGDLLDIVVAALPAQEPVAEMPATVRVAIVGRPNVGKSSLLNALLGDERAIVSSMPGTTRDAIDTRLTFEGVPICLIDTAGLRRPGKRTTTDVEYYSSLRAIRAMERSDIALVVVDASEGLVDLDLQVAYEAQRAKCATAVLFNKWDISKLDLDLATARVKAKVQMKPRWLTVSALTGRGIERILPLARELYDKYSARIPTPELNRWLEDVRTRRPAATRGVKSIKLFYIVQYGLCPPRFKIMVNSRALVNKPFAYYLENRLREDYDMWGIPLVIDFEGKEERYS
ncbi:MAG TPA: ribosome biogenesis GTPase Der [Thermoleophilia bacterium]|nr:ribosome biogenesis GTPase Der [Thermoleophilia bacterium]